MLVGAVALACGYFPIHTAYENGPHVMGVGLISFCSFLTGAGSCTAFSAAIKTCTLPLHTQKFPRYTRGLQQELDSNLDTLVPAVSSKNL